MSRKQTPWGIADDATELAKGIISYSTPGHGGIWLSAKRRDIVKKLVPSVKNWNGGFEWWEEDCDWAIPYLIFADDILAGGNAYEHQLSVEAAKSTIEHYHKEIDLQSIL